MLTWTLTTSLSQLTSSMQKNRCGCLSQGNVRQSINIIVFLVILHPLLYGYFHILFVNFNVFKS